MNNSRLCILPSRAVSDGELSDSEFRTLAALSIHSDGETGWCFPSQSTLAKIRGISRPLINRHIQKFVALGYVNLEHRVNAETGAQRSNLMQVRFDYPPVTSEVTPPVTSEVTPPVTSEVTPPVTSEVTHNYLINYPTNYTEEKDITSSSFIKEDDVREGLDDQTDEGASSSNVNGNSQSESTITFVETDNLSGDEEGEDSIDAVDETPLDFEGRPYAPPDQPYGLFQRLADVWPSLPSKKGQSLKECKILLGKDKKVPVGPYTSDDIVACAQFLNTDPYYEKNMVPLGVWAIVDKIERWVSVGRPADYSTWKNNGNKQAATVINAPAHEVCY